jgi:transglutaminase-like putative cysteine protease
MWNEVWITDRWIPLDATVGKGRVGVDHIKFHHSSLAGQTPYQVVTPITNVIGQLKIEFDGMN